MIYLTNKNRTDTQLETRETALTHARGLLECWGGASLLFFALLPDKRYLFGASVSGEWGVAYRVIGRHALALGDPLGAPGAVPEAVTAFLALCRSQRWKPAFYQVTPEHLDIYRAAGLNAIKIGEDAGIDLGDFSLGGKRFKNLRNDLRRLEKSSVVLETYGPEAPPSSGVTAEMAAISAGWRRAHRAKEGSFAMGSFDPDSALFRESRFFVARDSGSSRMLAFTTFVPVFGQGETQGWALDLLRRRGDALHGVMDFLIISAAQQFADEGAALLSLGLSPLAGAEETGEAAAVSYIRRFLFTRLNRVYNFQGLHTFKAKFVTQWEPRYLIYRHGLGLAATAGAILKAHLAANTPSAPSPVRMGRLGRRRTVALAALLLLVFMPFEKTLAKRAAVVPRRVAHTWVSHSPHWHTGHWNTSHWNRVLPRLGHALRVADDDAPFA